MIEVEVQNYIFAPLGMFIAFVIGMNLGAIYFGGLWLTVQYLPHARYPAVLTLVSFWTRMAVCLLGFYTVMNGQWERLLMCLLGFVCVRSLVVHFIPRWLPVRRSA